ncbi:hypothetical protein [Curtobacterium sp. MCJR17_043]|uniref:hypothetical protein n=1 Tax=Curtobacterium sp. MCJR17_043 TaxID=2175660 RepID=UPI0024E0141D|nr:hypothetical protein [Curtobacterium sp. MCJR17_043]WIB36817.1 hypothetical protein DEJ15_07350 [Curtobacterium sp. MCJR17_043]
MQVVPGFAGREVGPTDVLTWVWFPERSLPEGQTEPGGLGPRPVLGRHGVRTRRRLHRRHPAQ